MLGDVLGVNMMHSETSDQCWAKNGSLKSPPGIASPVQHSRDPVDKELCTDKAEHHTKGVVVII